MTAVMIYGTSGTRPKAAPFLRSADPYSAVVDGRLVWIWDPYTTTNQYPYSDFVDLAEVASPSSQEQAPSLGGDVNYLRNSVKVVVDAYEGTMRYYVSEPSDPIIQAWTGRSDDVHNLRARPAGAARALPLPGELFQSGLRYTTTRTDPKCLRQRTAGLAIDPTGPPGNRIRCSYYV